MSLPKAQLVDPKGNMNLPGMNATGVITASSFSGTGGVVTNLTGSPDLDVGIVTGSSFIGDGTGHAASLTGTPELNLGITTATSFVGDAVGKAAGLTGTPNLNVGLITATSFVGFVTGDVTGNISGLAASITPGVNLGVGVCTALELHGDGSTLTGAGSTAYIAQEITATGAETIIDLSNGNLIYYKGEANTTVGFASTSAAEQITFIRDTNPNYSISYSSGGVEFDGSGDYLEAGGGTDMQLGTGDFTIETFVYFNSVASGQIYEGRPNGVQGAYISIYLENGSDGTADLKFYTDSADRIDATDSIVASKWYHIAAVRNSSVTTLYIDGVSKGTYADTSDYTIRTDGPVIGISRNLSNNPLDGKLSNYRIVKGTAVYTDNFVPPSAALTNITNTKLLCCQSDSSTTAAAVSPATMTAGGNPTAGAQTISLSGSLNATITWPSTVKWNNNTEPTLIYSDYTSEFQIFHLTTLDTGATYNAWEEMQSTTKEVSLWSWGLGNYGALGQNDTTQRSSPTQIPGKWSPNFYGSQGHLAVSVPKTDGTLWSWGYTNHGQSGLNSVVNYSSPMQVGTDTTWSQSSSGYRYTLAVKTDGTLWSFGYNQWGTLANNTRSDNVRQSSPIQVPGTTWSKTSAMSTSAGAIKTDGTLWVWGSNGEGKLGQNDVVNRSSPTQIPGSWDASSVHNFGGSVCSALIKTDGTLWVWGRNQTGDLGVNTVNNGYSSPVQLPGTSWSSVSQANESGLATKTDGTLWAWGRNNVGQLAQNSNTTGISSPVQISGTNWSTAAGDILACEGGGGAAFAIKTDGTLWAWGQKGSYGVLGLNQGPAQGSVLSSPTQVGTATDWATLAGLDATPYAMMATRYS